MNPHLLKINLNPEHSFSARYHRAAHFYQEWHFHPELELVYIVKGSGHQFIGDNIHIFKPGDMLLLGSNLPHLWKWDRNITTDENADDLVEALVIHFTPDCFGRDFFQIPENKQLQVLIEKSKQAIRIKNDTNQKVLKLMQELLQVDKTERIILLLQILNTIAKSDQTRVLCTRQILIPGNPDDTERMNNIYQYVFRHFSRQITLEQIAGIAHLCPHSFCRYFKSRNNKTFSRFLIEYRIAYACKLLAETDKVIADICFECGYNSFSNFNRHFKSVVGRTPQAHRKYYQEIRKDYRQPVAASRA